MLAKKYSLLLWVLCLVFLLNSLEVNGQAQKGRDVKLEQEIHLKNGWVIRGKILEETNEKVRVETREGNVFVFAKDKITSITYSKKPKKDRGEVAGYSQLFQLLEWGIMSGQNVSRTDRNIAFSLFNATGLRLGNNAQIGLGYGVDVYREVIIAPVALHFRADLLKKTVITPFYFGDLGYGFAVSDRSDSYDNDPLRIWNNKGGLRYNTGIGLKMRSGNGPSWVISIGYFYQKSKQEKQYWTGGLLEKTVQYRRLSLRTGITF